MRDCGKTDSGYKSPSMKSSSGSDESFNSETGSKESSKGAVEGGYGEESSPPRRRSPLRPQPSTNWFGMHYVVPVCHEELFDLDCAQNVLGEILELLDSLYKKVLSLMNSG